MAKTVVPIELSSTPGIVDNSNATAITIDSSEDVTLAGHIILTDSKIVKLGTGADLQLYHDGSHSYINNSTGNLAFDVAGDFNIDADGGDIVFNDGGSEIGRFTNSSSDFVIKTATQDKDLIFKGNDGGSVITALTLDYSDAGTAIFNHDIKLGDNSKVHLGAGTDFSVYHTGSHGYVENNTGDLVLLNNANDKDIIFQSDDGAGSTTTYFRLDGSAATHDGSNTTATYTKFPDKSYLTFGAGDDLQIYHDGNYSYIKDAGTGDLRIQASTNVQIYNSALDKQSANFHTAGPVTLYYDNAAKFATSSSGITVTGEVAATSLDISGDADIDGTLEADAITVDGTTLAEYISDTTGAMFSSNTETGITATYQDSDNTIDLVVGTLNQDTTGTAAKVTVTDSTANTNFPVVFHDESNALLDDTGALRYNPSTGTLLVPNLSVSGTTTTVDTVTMEAQNAIIFEGATADGNETTLSIVDPTADHTQYLINQGGYIPVLAAATTTAITSTPAELNILDGVTSTTAELNILDGVTSTAAELNILDGVTSTAAELNILDGVTSTTAELNLLDGSTANTVVNSKAVVYGSSGELAGTLSTAAQTNITSVGTLTTLTVDEITINADTITATDDFIIDATTNIFLDADGGEVVLRDGGTNYGYFHQDSDNFEILSTRSNGDIIFKGNDGGSTITALTLDMSDAGTATFNHDIRLGDNGQIILGAGSDFSMYHDGSNTIMNEAGTGGLRISSSAVRMDLNSDTDYSSTGEPAGILTLYNSNGSDGAGVNNYSSLEFNTGDGATSQGFINYVRTGDNQGKFTFSQRTAANSYAESVVIDNSGNIDVAGIVDGTNFKINGAQGSDGQVLTSTGSGVAWEDAAGGVTGISSNADATAMTIDSNEKIIIGDTASHVDDLLQIETPASGGGHGIQIRRNDSNSDQLIGRIMFGNNTDTDLATISAVTDGANDNARLAFSTQPDGGSSTERMRIDHNGVITAPAQPAFDAGRNSGYVTDDQNFIQDYARTNIGSHYDTSNGRFTAPVAGQYLVMFRIFTHDSGGVVQAEVTLKKNAGDAFIARAHKVGGYHTPVQVTKVLTLAANDYIQTYVGDSGTSSGWQGSAHEYNYFCAFLIG